MNKIYIPLYTEIYKEIDNENKNKKDNNLHGFPIFDCLSTSGR